MSNSITPDKSAPVRLLNSPTPLPCPTPHSSASFAGRLPFAARVHRNLVLTAPGTPKEKRHLELDFADGGLLYEPGDAIGVAARNDPRVVARLLDAFGLRWELPLQLSEEATTLGDALLTSFEITWPSPKFLRAWAAASGSAELHLLGAPDNTEARRKYLRDNHIIDIVRQFTARGLDAERIVAGLRPLQPRLYSIASSPAACPNRIDFLFSTVRYHLNGELRLGVVSGHQLAPARQGSSLSVHIEENAGFHLPAADAPIIMIGAGTGVAPFRAFISERRLQGATGRSWLFFGTGDPHSDFLYRDEWQQALDDGYLTRLDLAFSRDPPGKIYVQRRLAERGREVYRWLENGASVYVCGDAAAMAPAVHHALLEIIRQHGGVELHQATAYLRDMALGHRYLRSIY